MTEVPLQGYINKTVDFNYHGCRLRFHLSHALFSSFAIDDGTRLLLKTIAGQIDFTNRQRVLDLGCGVGVIGLALKKKYPELEVELTDRDALALAFTEENTGLNKIKSVQTRGQLGLPEPDAQYDLIVSNIPAKIGIPALADLIARCLAGLTKQGVCCIVIIAALKDELLKVIGDLQAGVLLQEESSRHVVFHLQSQGPVEYVKDAFAPYIRRYRKFALGATSYKASTAYNLADFDTLGFQVLTAMRFLEKQPLSGRRLLLLNPGQGHLACYLQAQHKGEPLHFTIAGRDLLQLKITDHNLAEQGVGPEQRLIAHLPSICRLEGPFDELIVFPEIIPECNWTGELWDNLPALMNKESRLVLVVKNSHQHRLLLGSVEFTQLRKTKYKGYTVAALKKK